MMITRAIRFLKPSVEGEVGASALKTEAREVACTANVCLYFFEEDRGSFEDDRFVVELLVVGVTVLPLACPLAGRAEPLTGATLLSATCTAVDVALAMIYATSGDLAVP